MGGSSFHHYHGNTFTDGFPGVVFFSHVIGQQLYRMVRMRSFGRNQSNADEPPYFYAEGVCVCLVFVRFIVFFLAVFCLLAEIPVLRYL